MFACPELMGKTVRPRKFWHTGISDVAAISLKCVFTILNLQKTRNGNFG